MINLLCLIHMTNLINIFYIKTKILIIFNFCYIFSNKDITEVLKVFI